MIGIPAGLASGPRTRGSISPFAWAIILILATAAIPGRDASAQEQKKAEPAKAADVFDDEAKEEKKPEEAKAAGPGGTPKAPATSDRDTIGFTQENVAAQMTELEERMFRLSEALASLEPENASRLRLALKFSREELILAQMKETQGLLKEAQLAKAETEARELLAKLEHLRRLLLAEDLDFQMKLARLRQMRETMAQLDRIINEEKRELSWSRKAVDDQSGLTKLRDRKAELEKLVRDQQGAVDDTMAANRKEGEAARKEARQAVSDREAAIRKRAASLAADPVVAADRPEHLKQADPHLQDAIAHLGTKDGDAAVADERRRSRRSGRPSRRSPGGSPPPRRRSPRPNSASSSETRTATGARPTRWRRPRPGWATAGSRSRRT